MKLRRIECLFDSWRDFWFFIRDSLLNERFREGCNDGNFEGLGGWFRYWLDGELLGEVDKSKDGWDIFGFKVILFLVGLEISVFERV
jgi:hypothetical protein